MEKTLKTNLHRWDIAHKGHCKWYYVDHEKEILHLFNQKHDLNYIDKGYNIHLEKYEI